MSYHARKLLLLAALMCSPGLNAQMDTYDPSTLLESTASHIFSEVNKNREEYKANPEDLAQISVVPGGAERGAIDFQRAEGSDQ